MTDRLVSLSVATLPRLQDGKAAAMIDHELTAAIRDCLERPVDKRPRVVNVKVKMSPVSDGEGICDSIKFSVEANHATPAQVTREYDAIPDRHGKILFSPTSPDQARQRTLMDEEPAGADDDAA